MGEDKVASHAKIKIDHSRFQNRPVPKMVGRPAQGGRRPGSFACWGHLTEEVICGSIATAIPMGLTRNEITAPFRMPPQWT